MWSNVTQSWQDGRVLGGSLRTQNHPLQCLASGPEGQLETQMETSIKRLGSDC